MLQKVRRTDNSKLNISFMRWTCSEVSETSVGAGVRGSHRDYLQLVLSFGVARHQSVATASRRCCALVAIAQVATADTNQMNGQLFLN